MKTYIVRRTHTSAATEIDSEREYDIVVLESDSDNRVITLKDTKLIIKKVSSLKSKPSQQSREETSEQIWEYSALL